MEQKIGYVSISLLTKLVVGNLVRGLPNIKFGENKICDACVKGKQTKVSFKSKKEIITSKPLEFIHMDLYSLVKFQTRGGKKYIIVVVNNFSRRTWTMFLRPKD